MDTLPDKLRALTEKKYFAYIAVVFFAFVTALVFALLAQQASVQNVDMLRSNIKNDAPANMYPGSDLNNNGSVVDPKKPESAIDKFFSRISGKKSTNTQTNNQTGGTNPGQSNNTSGKKNTSGTNIPSNNQKEVVEKIDEVLMPLPKVVVKDYVLQTELPSAPQSAKIYKLQTNYSEADIEKMAATFGMASPKSDSVVIEKNGNGLTQLFDLKNNLYLAVNNQTGTMLFSAQNGIPSLGGDAKQNALALARSLGYTQSCLKATSSYTKKSEPHTTHIDIHCDWGSAGAPIVNYFGILNLPLAEALKNVSLGQLPSTSSDGDIKDDDSGELTSRPNDFNTITVQQDTLTGNIMAFSSNIMPVLSEIDISADRIVLPSEGFEKLRNNEKQFAFAGPQGSGSTDLRSVYINNTAQADSVNLTDFVLAYPVIPGVKQEYMCPEWVTRSQGRLESGYDGTFVESARAINDSRCSRTSVLGASIAQATTLPIANPTVIDPLSHADTLQYKTITIQGEPLTESACPVKDQFTNAMKISDGVYLAWIDRNERGPGNKRLGMDGQLTGPLIQREWWIATTSQQMVTGTLGTGEKLPPNLASSYMRFRNSTGVKSKIGSRSDNPISSVSGTIVACKYLTTGSPSLYVYSSTAKNVHVELNPLGGIAFAQPALSALQGWNFITQPDGTLEFGNNVINNRAYYEYNKKTLTEALEKTQFEEKGYVVKKEELLTLFATKISLKMGLSKAQNNDLISEIKRELHVLGSSHVKIVLLPRAILDKYLPVSLSPAPKNFYRYFFIIEPASDEEFLTEPEFSPIQKSEYFAVETGTLVKTSY